MTLENEERSARGPRVDHNIYYNEVQKKLVSRLFLSFGTEENKKFLQKNPQAEISVKEIIELASILFQKLKCVTYERYKFSTRMQEQGATLETFHATLAAQAARSDLGTLEDEIVRDLFISEMKNMTLQDTLTFETLAPEEVIREAYKLKHSKITTMAFQKKVAGMKFKKEPVMTVRTSNGSARKQPVKREYNRRQKNNRSATSSGQTKPFNSCGRRVLDQGHLKSCAAMGKTFKNCGNLTSSQKCADHSK